MNRNPAKEMRTLTDEQVAVIASSHQKFADEKQREAAQFQRWADAARKELRNRKRAQAA